MVRPAKAFTAEQASEKDLEIIEAQLGRTPRDVFSNRPSLPMRGT